jgi:hypothetical protein
MTVPRQYATAGAFRSALESRLNERARHESVDLGRLRRQVAFDRLLARMFDPSQALREGWILKGGYALEMRFLRAFALSVLGLSLPRHVKAIAVDFGDAVPFDVIATAKLVFAQQAHFEGQVRTPNSF